MKKVIIISEENKIKEKSKNQKRSKNIVYFLLFGAIMLILVSLLFFSRQTKDQIVIRQSKAVNGQCSAAFGGCGMECCSPFGWCGTSNDHCGAGCQPSLGRCGSTIATIPSSPSGVKLAWSDCTRTIDRCEGDFVCCVAPADRASGKTTCRNNVFDAPNGCVSASTGSTPSGRNLAAWADCIINVDVCPGSYTCCSAPADVSSGKTTCRLANAVGQGYGCASNAATTSVPTVNVAAFGDCVASQSVCPNGFTCCIGPLDSVSRKFTCRSSTSTQNDGCLSSSPNVPPPVSEPEPNLNVAAFSACHMIRDRCVPGFICCVGPDETSSGRTTCRLPNSYGRSSGCQGRLHPGVDSAKTVQTYFRCNRPGVFALTFDDGTSQYTNQLLDILSAKNVKASFFINGQNRVNLLTPSERAKVTRIRAEGHDIGSHSYNHMDFTGLDDQRAYDQWFNDEIAFRQILGVTPNFARFPYGFYSTRNLNQLGSWGFRANIMWNLDTKDWEHSAATNAAQQTLDAVKAILDNASSTSSSWIALNHEFIGSTSLVYTAQVIDYVRSKGYQFVTISDCIGDFNVYR